MWRSKRKTHRGQVAGGHVTNRVFWVPGIFDPLPSVKNHSKRANERHFKQKLARDRGGIEHMLQVEIHQKTLEGNKTNVEKYQKEPSIKQRTPRNLMTNLEIHKDIKWISYLEKSKTQQHL